MEYNAIVNGMEMKRFKVKRDAVSYLVDYASKQNGIDPYSLGMIWDSLIEKAPNNTAKVYAQKVTMFGNDYSIERVNND